MKIENVRHDFPKNAGYLLERPDGSQHYIFAHYYTPVVLRLGETTFHTNAGACVLIGPGISQYLYSEKPLIHNWIHFTTTPEALAQLCQIPVNTPFYIPDSDRISDWVRKIEIEFFSHERHREIMLQSEMQEFLIWLDRALWKPPISVSVPKAVESAVIGIRKRVLLQPEQNWTIQQMAQLVPLSESRFHAVYKAMFGTTPAQDLIQARIENAKVLLQNKPDISMKEAAELLGYNDQYHFIRQFKAVTGKTPGAYRRS